MIRRKRCKNCKELFEPKFSTVQMVCSPKCAIEYSKIKNMETKEKNKKELDKMFIEKKQREGLTTLIKTVVDNCHLYVRLRDINKPCISCGTQYKSDFDAGHCFSANKYSSLKFNEFNINGQCIQCNRFNEGNQIQYLINLPDRIGKDKFKELVTIAENENKSGFKWDRENLIQIRNYYKDKIKELKK
jgi:hypothetical protein